MNTEEAGTILFPTNTKESVDFAVVLDILLPKKKKKKL